MKSSDQIPAHFSEKFVLAFFVPVGLWNVMAQGSILAGFSFRTLSIAYTAGLLVILAVYVRRAKVRGAWTLSRDHEERVQTYALACLCLIGASLSFVSVRPLWDDALYIGGRAVYFAEFPSAPLDFNFHDHGLVDFPVSYPMELAQTINLLWGYLAYISGVPCLDIFHMVVPILGGMLIPLAHYLAVSRFCENRWATMVGVAGIFAFLCIDGGTALNVRAFGNWAFVGIWLGKAILMSIFLPVFIAFSMDWFSHGSARNWYKLFVLGLAGAGLSGSALFMLPLLALALAGGHLCAQGIHRGMVKTVAGYFASLVYVAAVALYLKCTITSSSMHHLGFEYGFPGSLSGQWRLIFGGPLNMTAITFVVALGLALIVSARSQRRFLAAWVAILLAVALNPVMMPFVAENLTTLNGYWRLFFLLPFPLTLGTAIAHLCQMSRVDSPRAAIVGCTVIVIFAFLFNVVDYGRDPKERVAVFSKISFGLFAHKLQQPLEREVKEIIAASLPGTMIAPPLYSALIPLFTNSIPQVAVRNFFLFHASIANGRRDEAESKLAAITYLSGTSGQGLMDLEKLLVKPELKNVVVDTKIKNNSSLLGALGRHGFSRTLEGKSFVLFIRS